MEMLLCYCVIGGCNTNCPTRNESLNVFVPVVHRSVRQNVKSLAVVLSLDYLHVTIEIKSTDLNSTQERLFN